MEIFNLVMVFILIAFTGFFVAVEFAIVKIRTSRIDQLVAEKKPGALAAKKVITNLDEYLSACQLGITITAMGLGWLGEPTVHHMLQPLFERMNISGGVANTLSFIIAFGTMTYLHVVVGELAPKTFAIQKAERVTLLFSKPLIYFYKVMYPFIWVLNGSARFLTGVFGLKPASEHEMAHTEEELRLILSESYHSGEINQTEFKYVNKIFEFDNRIAKEIMVPRTEMVGLYLDDPIKEHIKTLKSEQYTRYPVFGEDKDDVVGIVNVKDFFIHSLGESELQITSLKEFTRPVLKVIETMAIHDLLVQMQKKRIQMAILYDEYGGTAGLVTLEDIIEEIIGEVRDEYDEDERPRIQEIGINHKIIDGKVLISEVNEMFDLYMDDEDVDTIAGWMLMQNPDLRKNVPIIYEGYEFRILEKDVNHIKRVEIKPVAEPETEASVDKE
ncbi:MULTISPECIES: hemolysin family protein [Brevibacillus]|uniref:hemolysin family protein n=1 Tax=Brevibacillus TaxID=55080 RepID=UPI000E2F45B4|nr:MULTISPECIES: hemolysin family protein [Brevibacillus]MCG7317551.1 hemolysin family protein [Brevibacillus laterosporus]MED1789159.1 hemolysin family protein [Brevibacillus laterosporus]RFB34882.1 HlyC/CorC family transporter [Brevibacillus sp. VP]